MCGLFRWCLTILKGLSKMQKVKARDLVVGKMYYLDGPFPLLFDSLGYISEAQALWSRPHVYLRYKEMHGGYRKLHFKPVPEDGPGFNFLSIHTAVFPDGLDQLFTFHKSPKNVMNDRLRLQAIGNVYSAKTGMSGDPSYGPGGIIANMLGVRPPKGVVTNAPSNSYNRTRKWKENRAAKNAFVELASMNPNARRKTRRRQAKHVSA
jgi:hypothetical protein